MIANWIHIVIVHFAVIGTLWLFFRVFIHRKKALDGSVWKDNYSFSIILGLIATISYYTGPEAADHLKTSLDSYPQELIEDHALWGRAAFVIQVITALVGIMGWASILQEETPDRRITPIMMALLMANTLVIIYTSHLGGQIRRLDLIF